MRVCIVGGSGNISRYVTPLLVAHGHDVTVFNRGQTGEAPAGVHQLTGDRQDRAAFEAAMQAARFDAAIDFICFNADDARSDLRAFRDVKHLVHVSTVMTYGLELKWFPATEDHPLLGTSGYAVNKNAADAIFREAYYRDGFPVTVVKPSCTLGGTNGPRRMVSGELTWLDRIRRGKPVLIVNDGMVMYQFLHSRDAAVAFAHLLGRERCVGQTYNLTQPGFTWWRDHHRAVMKVLGREVELVSISRGQLERLDVPKKDVCLGNYGWHSYHSIARLQRDVPEFRPRVGLEEMLADVIGTLDRSGAIPDASVDGLWEDSIIANVKALR